MDARPKTTTRADELVGHLDAIARRFLFHERRGRHRDVCLSGREVRVLIALGGGERIMSHLARELMCSMSGATAIVDRLVAKGLVARQRSEQDRRVVSVALTDEGKRLHAERRQARRAMAEGMLGALDARDRATFVGLMRQIREAVAGPTGPRSSRADGTCGGEPGA
jgi:DNA-binding MarR family transcriptional regulator